jgi:hypothetical protein
VTWKGTVFKGICNPGDQREIQKKIDEFINGDTTQKGLLKFIEQKAPLMLDGVKRLL